MRTEDPEDPSSDVPGGASPSDETPGTEEPRIPPADPADQETKRYAVARAGESLRVRVSGGEVARSYAPAKLLAELAEYIAQAVQGFNGGRAMIYRLEPGSSMDLYFGDPQPEDAQSELPLQQTFAAAETIAGLMELDSDELFSRALDIGPRIRSYDALARFVVSEDITLEWTPDNRPTRRLDPRHAARQHERLNAEPELQERSIQINGVLYRIIEDPVAKRGRIGIGIFDWSAEPPGHRAPGKVLIDFDGPELHEQIRPLIGEVVEAVVLVRQPRPGTSVDLERVDLSLISIAPGEGDVAAYGIPLFDADER